MGILSIYTILTTEKRYTICGYPASYTPGGCLDSLQLNMPMVCSIMAGFEEHARILRCKRVLEANYSWHKTFFVVPSVSSILTNLSTSNQGVSQWKSTSNCTCPAPDRHRLSIGSLKPILYKAKPIVRWGRKATGLDISCWPSFKISCSFRKDSRAAECDVVKVTLRQFGFFYTREHPQELGASAKKQFHENSPVTYKIRQSTSTGAYYRYVSVDVTL